MVVLLLLGCIGFSDKYSTVDRLIFELSMSLQSSLNPQHDPSLYTLRLATLSSQLTPIMQLQCGQSPVSSALQPRVLIFSGESNMDGYMHREKEEAQLFYGSRLYESIEVAQEIPPSFQVFDNERDSVLPSEFLHEQVNPTVGLSRKGSIIFFSEQLNQLKKNVDKLITIINSRNPEESGSKDSLKNEGGRDKIDAKSTESQKIEDSFALQKEIGEFQSPSKLKQLSFSNISPISHKFFQQKQKRSNVCCDSSRSLMQRKMRGGAKVGPNSA